FAVGAAWPAARLMNAAHGRPRRFNRALVYSSKRMHITGSCPSCATRGVFTCHYQGVSHAEWPKAVHEHAPTQIICYKAVVIECCPPRTTSTPNTISGR